MDFTIHAVGDSAVKVVFSKEVSPELNAEVRRFCGNLEIADIKGIVEWVPAFDSVTIYYEPQQILYKDISKEIHGLHHVHVSEKLNPSRLIHVPVLYAGEYGPDLIRVAEYNHLTVEEVIKIHQQPDYLIYMIGFLPGFPYLGGLDKSIAAPRLEEPRTRTFAGAVGIADMQTGVYPVDSPGGWNIIGKTPLQLFDRHRENNAFLLQAGDRVRFYSVSEYEFEKVEEQIKNGVYDVRVEERDYSHTRKPNV
ncbi:5-oxoprolinase subunit PxpB [Virgibacillus ainsalahensis]